MSHTGDTRATTLPYEEPVPRFRRRRALVVDDERSTRELRRQLASAGFEVEKAGESAGALERARADRFDIVVFDLNAPGLDDLVLCRRSGTVDAPSAGHRIQSRSVTLDAERRDTVVDGLHVDLTRHEFDLLYLLASRPGVVFSRTALLAKVWSADVYVTERTVDTVVSRLRKKLQRRAPAKELIITAWGVGYKFADAG